MKKLATILSRIQFGRRRSSNATKLVVAVSIVLCMVALITLRLSMNDVQNRTEKLYNRAAALEQENSSLENKIANLGTVQSVMEIAKEELGLVQPDTVIFVPAS